MGWGGGWEGEVGEWGGRGAGDRRLGRPAAPLVVVVVEVVSVELIAGPAA